MIYFSTGSMELTFIHSVFTIPSFDDENLLIRQFSPSHVTWTLKSDRSLIWRSVSDTRC